MANGHTDGWERWNTEQTGDSTGHLTPTDRARKDAIEMIAHTACMGRVKLAWGDCRREIIKHFDNRPCDGSTFANRVEPYGWYDGTANEWAAYRAKRIIQGKRDHAEWLAALHDLLALRRSIHDLSAKAAARRSPVEAMKLAHFNRTFYQEG